MILGKCSATSCEARAGSTPNFAASPLICSDPRIFWIWSPVNGCLGSESTHEENTFPRPACVNVCSRPCTPPVCMGKRLRVVMMGFAVVLRSAFPPMTELVNDITFLAVVSCLLTIIKSHHGTSRSRVIVRVDPNLVHVEELTRWKDARPNKNPSCKFAGVHLRRASKCTEAGMQIKARHSLGNGLRRKSITSSEVSTYLRPGLKSRLGGLTFAEAPFSAISRFNWSPSQPKRGRFFKAPREDGSSFRAELEHSTPNERPIMKFLSLETDRTHRRGMLDK